MGPALVNSSAIAAHSWVGLRIMRRARSNQAGSLGSGLGFCGTGFAGPPTPLGGARGGVGPRDGGAGPRGAVGPRGGCTGVGMDPRGLVVPQDTQRVTRRTSHAARSLGGTLVERVTCVV